jgi:NAD(P)-dependent dehydrogenase (short-subunit alcohol dehydrogenase family)
LQVALPYVDQYLPSKATLVRQKLSELGLSNVSPMSFAQTLQGDPTTDALVQAAATAPQQMQSRLYQQAANKALEEGDVDRARQIANDHLQNNARDAVMQRIDFRDLAKKAEGARIEEIRQTVARLQTDGEKIDLLVLLAGDVQKGGNQKLATQLLEDAKQIVNHRATNYEQFEQQLKVAHAFAAVDPTRSFEILDPGISQLNELLSAAALLSGFEINMFRDGEMAIQGGNGLTATINRYGQELAVLAREDFERSETLTGRFQFPEPRIMTRMAIVQGLLGVRPVSGPRAVLGNFGNSVVIRP